MSDALALLHSMRDHVGQWSEKATDDQRSDAAAILAMMPSRRFRRAAEQSARRHWLSRSKGYSKTRDVAAMAISALATQLEPGQVAYCAASDAEQAGLVLQSVRAFVDGTPALAEVLTVESRRVVARNRGTELVVLAADSAGSHGLRPAMLLVDELANWPDVERHRSFFDSLWAGLPKVPASRGVIMTTPGSPSHFSKRIYDGAVADPEMWRVSTLLGPAPWISRAEVESERRRLVPSTFARLWLGEWAQSEDQLVDPVDLAAAQVLDGPIPPAPSTAYVCTLDVGTKRDRSVACIAHAVTEPTGTRVVVDYLQVWKPSPLRPVSLDAVRAWLLEFAKAYRARIIFDPSQAYLLAEQLRKAGVACEEFVFGTASVGKIATALINSLRARLIDLPKDRDLTDELLAVRLRESAPNVLRLDHASGGHDDMAVAIGMAVYSLTVASSPAPTWYFPAHKVSLPALAGKELLVPLGRIGAISKKDAYNRQIKRKYSDYRKGQP